MRFRILYLIGLIGLFLAACGTVAEPREPFAPTNTALPRATDIVKEHPTSGATETTREAAAVATSTPLPTATLVPTATPTEEQPTQTPTVEPTEEPTEIPTEVPTEAPTEAAPEGVVVNGIMGDPVSGEYWFRNFPNPTTGQMCVTCHNPDAPVPGLGPYLYGIADRAGSRRPGYSAVDYLLESIVDPRAFIAPPQQTPDGQTVEFNPELMPTDWALALDDVARADIISFLMTLHEGK